MSIKVNVMRREGGFFTPFWSGYIEEMPKEGQEYTVEGISYVVEKIVGRNAPIPSILLAAPESENYCIRLAEFDINITMRPPENEQEKPTIGQIYSYSSEDVTKYFGGEDVKIIVIDDNGRFEGMQCWIGQAFTAPDFLDGMLNSVAFSQGVGLRFEGPDKVIATKKGNWVKEGTPNDVLTWLLENRSLENQFRSDPHKGIEN